MSLKSVFRLDICGRSTRTTLPPLCTDSRLEAASTVESKGSPPPLADSFPSLLMCV